MNHFPDISEPLNRLFTCCNLASSSSKLVNITFGSGGFPYSILSTKFACPVSQSLLFLYYVLFMIALALSHWFLSFFDFCGLQTPPELALRAPKVEDFSLPLVLMNFSTIFFPFMMLVLTYWLNL